MQKQKADPVLLTADEVAVILRTTKAAVYRMGERGKLKGSIVKIGRRTLFKKEALFTQLGL